MTTTDHPKTWAVPPGEVLIEALEERGLSQAELARRMNRPLKTINEIIKAKTALTPDTALQLERTLGISARFWNGLEANWRAQLAEQRANEELEASIPWVKRFPLKTLVRHELIPAGSRGPGLVAAVLRYFEVSSVEAWDRVWAEPVASYRATTRFESSPEAVAAWLRWGQIEAAKVDCPHFDRSALLAAVPELRRLSRREPFASAVEDAQRICKAAGIVVLVLPETEGSRLSGAAWWATSTKGVVQLTMRYKRDDQFWFSFFHELGHLVLGHRGTFVHDPSSSLDVDVEASADGWAREALIPQNTFDTFLAAGDFSRNAIRATARDMQVSPGVVVGRLQRDGTLDMEHLNDLKRPVHWTR